MKAKNIIKFAFMAAGSLLFLSCDKFLDELPDNRTEIDTPEKIAKILISAYPETAPYGMMEMMSDNVTDAGSRIEQGYKITYQSYRYRDVDVTSDDSPHLVWQDCYKAIGSANVAIKEALRYEDFDEVKAQLGEAYLCRAFAHFLLSNLFCQAYNPKTCDVDMGVPYVMEPETTVIVDYPRGTVADVYEKIAADIEAGFPLIDDSSYSVPMYHFTKRAAAAFAAQFYLYYGDYEKSAEYSDYVLGENPQALFRKWGDTWNATNTDEMVNKFIANDESANIFCHGIASWYLFFRSYRYVHTYTLTSETTRSKGPWSTDGWTTLPAYSKTYSFGSGPHYAVPKIRVAYLMTDPVAGIGIPFTVKVSYCTEKSLIDRAEANVMMKQYDAAARDLSLFYSSAYYESKETETGPRNVDLTADDIAGYYNTLAYYTEKTPTVKKKLNSGFTVEPGKQENLLHACLHARRIITLEEGDRLMDLKRYGIEWNHIIEDEESVEIKAYDLRLAVQLPETAIKAGAVPNPR